jgi:hypothetical protein
MGEMSYRKVAPWDTIEAMVWRPDETDLAELDRDPA